MQHDSNPSVVRAYGRQAAVDAGLRAYMLRVYNYMAMGLGLTGAVAMVVASSPTMMQAIFGTPLQWVVMLAPLGFVVFLSVRLESMKASTAQMMFWAYAALMGLSLSSIFLIYTGASIAKVFFICAAMFGSVSLYGYTTKRDLSSWGTFLFMGLIGIFIASLVNLFLQSSMMGFVLSVIGVVVFTGLTAYDTQMIKSNYHHKASEESATKTAIFGALSLYMDFINLFLNLLRLFGERR
ncbi:MAG: Bax inhibitor-1/YccA family protein [Holosporales bacterium]